MKNKKVFTYAVVAIASAIAAVLARMILFLFYTEKDTGVYTRGSVFPSIIGIAIAVIIIALIVFALISKKEFSALNIPSDTRATCFASAVLGFMFLASSLILLLTMITQKKYDPYEVILTVLGVLSCAYYLSVIFSRARREQMLALFSMLPIVWSMVALIEVYFDNSVLITSPNRIFNQLALISLSVFFLTESRVALKFENTMSYAPAAAACTILCAASSLPNLLFGHTISRGLTDRPIVYALEFAAALYSAVKLISASASDES